MRGPKPARRAIRRGFTLIEVMVVVIIVGILAAIAVPIYNRYVRNSRVTEATNRMGDILTAARTFAAQNAVPGRPTQWPQSCGAQGFLGDCADSENFRYRLLRNGEVLTIFGLGVRKMRGVQVIMTVNGLQANGVISVSWRAPAASR